tara:strand:- start:720 stop:1040 length:321 start_codon:yes stop_codon:yes gene_type:complete
MSNSKLDVEIRNLELEISRIGKMLYSPELLNTKNNLECKLKNLHSKRNIKSQDKIKMYHQNKAEYAFKSYEQAIKDNKPEAASKHLTDYNNYKEMALTLAKAWGLE